MRGWKKAVKGVVLCAALLGASSGAFGAAGEIKTDVVPLSVNVTYSSGATQKSPALKTYIGYTATMTNNSPNTINSVVFVGTIYPSDVDEQIAFSSADGASCSVIQNSLTAPANAVTVQCVFGQFKAADTRSFALFFIAPEKDLVTPTNPDNVTFSGLAVTAEGYNGGNSQNDSRDSWTAANVLLGTSNPTLVKTAVPKSGGSFFTGTGGISLSGDPIATTVTLPTLSTFTTATIQEGSTTSAVTCTNFLVCYSTSLTIPGTFTPYLTVVVRLDKANIKPGTKIESVLVYYDGELVGDCASPTTPTGTGKPCIAKRTYYKNKSVPNWTSELDGDFEWTLINTLNGRLEFF